MRVEEPKALICEICGNTFPGKRNAKYCSEKCARIGRNRRRSGEPEERICPICETKFVTDEAHRKFCSEKCAIEANRIRNRKYQIEHRKNPQKEPEKKPAPPETIKDVVKKAMAEGLSYGQYMAKYHPPTEKTKEDIMKLYQTMGIKLTEPEGLAKIMTIRCAEIPDRYSPKLLHCKYPDEIGAKCCACKAERLLDQAEKKR